MKARQKYRKSGRNFLDIRVPNPSCNYANTNLMESLYRTSRAAEQWSHDGVMFPVLYHMTVEKLIWLFEDAKNVHMPRLAQGLPNREKGRRPGGVSGCDAAWVGPTQHSSFPESRACRHPWQIESEERLKSGKVPLFNTIFLKLIFDNKLQARTRKVLRVLGNYESADTEVNHKRQSSMRNSEVPWWLVFGPCFNSTRWGCCYSFTYIKHWGLILAAGWGGVFLYTTTRHDSHWNAMMPSLDRLLHAV